MCQCCRWPLPGSISIDCEDGGSFRHCGECHVVCTHALDLLLIELASDRPGGRCIHRTFDPRRSISHACACTRRMPFSFTPPLSRWLLFFLLLSSFSLRPMSFPPCPSTSSTVSLSDPPLLLSLSLLLRARTRPHDARLVACIDVSDTSMAKGRLGSPLPPSELTRRKKKTEAIEEEEEEGGREGGTGSGFRVRDGRGTCTRAWRVENDALQACRWVPFVSWLLRVGSCRMACPLQRMGDLTTFCLACVGDRDLVRMG